MIACLAFLTASLGKEILSERAAGKWNLEQFASPEGALRCLLANAQTTDFRLLASRSQDLLDKHHPGHVADLECGIFSALPQ